MTPHDCATQWHEWRVVSSVYVCADCGASRIIGLDTLLYESTLESILRRALTDAVLREAEGDIGDAIRLRFDQMRDVLIAAILTTAREDR